MAVAVGRKLAAELIAREPMAEIAALATECFKQLVATPHVVVRVNDTLHEFARERIDEIAQHRGFEGRLVVLAEPEIAPGDCRIEWADGGLTRDQAATDAMIAELVSRYIAARQPPTERSFGRTKMSDNDGKVPLPDLEMDSRRSAAPGRGPGRAAAPTAMSTAAPKTSKRCSTFPCRFRPFSGARAWRSANCSSSDPAPCSNSIARSARPSTSTSTTAWSPAAKSCWSKTSSA